MSVEYARQMTKSGTTKVTYRKDKFIKINGKQSF